MTSFCPNTANAFPTFIRAYKAPRDLMCGHLSDFTSYPSLFARFSSHFFPAFDSLNSPDSFLLRDLALAVLTARDALPPDARVASSFAGCPCQRFLAPLSRLDFPLSNSRYLTPSD